MSNGGFWSDRQTIGMTALIATAALWGTNHVVARAVNETISLPALVFWRWFPAAVFLTFAARTSLRRSRGAIRQNIAQISFGGVVGVGLFSFLLLGGAYASPALEVGIINATTPVWVTLLTLMMGTANASGRIAAGLALALLGTVIIVAKGHIEDLGDFRFSTGNLLSLMGAIAFAWFSIRVREWTRVIEPFALTVVTAWAGIAFVMLPAYIASVVTGGPWLLTSDSALSIALASVAYMALGPTMLGNYFYLFGVSAIGPQRAAVFLYLSPVFAAVLAIGWLSETFAWFHAVGVVLILAGLWAVQRPTKK